MPELVKDISELLKSDKIDDITQAEKLIDSGAYDESGKLIEQPGQPEPPVQQQVEQPPVVEQQVAQNPEQPQQPTSPETPQNNPNYEYKDYHGNKQVFDDTDGFLGSKNIDTFKKRFVDSQTYSQTLLKEKRVVQAEKRRAEANANKLQQEIDRYKNQSYQQTVQPESQQPVAPQPTQPVYQQPGIAPNRPDVDEDPANWTVEDSQKMKRWGMDLSSYTSQVGSQTQNLSNKYDNVDKRIEEQDQKIASLEQDKKEIQFKQAEDKYWTEINSLSSKVDKFKLPQNLNIKDVHGQILNWTDAAATAAGIYQSGDDEYSKQAYEQQRDDLVQRYLEKDPQAQEQLKNVMPPQGYQQYFNMVDLNRQRQDLINSNELGQNASLEATYAFLNFKNGNMNQTFNDVQKDSMIQGQQAVFNAMAENQQQFASTLPNDPKIQQEPQSSEQRMAEVLGMDYGKVEADPKLKQEYDKYMEAISGADLSQQ